MEPEHILSGIALRPVAPADEPFLFDLYASTRAEELAQVSWDEATRRAFLTQQFQAQQVHYQSYYPSGEHQIVLRDGRPVGRLYLNRSAERLHVLDIALLPAARGAGLGSALMRGLIGEAERAGLPVTLYVYRFDARVVAWYERLGFVAQGDTGMHIFMQRVPAAAPGQTSRQLGGA